MAKQNAKERALRGDFKGVTVRKSGDGRFTVDLSALPGADVTVITDGTVQQLRLIAPEEQANTATVTKKAYNIGDKLPDGWVVGPVSPETGNVMALEPVDGALDGYQTWHKGQDHAAELRGKGNANARQPSDNELNAIYNDVVKADRNGNAKLNPSGSNPFGNYWSSTPDPHSSDLARIQYFDGGIRVANYKDGANARVRCVRDEPGLTLA